MWKSQKRELPATLAIYSKDILIDIGPYKIDLYRYLKTELWNNWFLRSIPPPDSRDRYFCYFTSSKYKPKPHHFECFSENMTPEGICKDINKMIAKLEKLKKLTTEEKIRKSNKYKARI